MVDGQNTVIKSEMAIGEVQVIRGAKPDLFLMKPEIVTEAADDAGR